MTGLRVTTLVLALWYCFASGAIALTLFDPPEYSAIDTIGVDLSSGGYQTSIQAVSIGDLEFRQLAGVGVFAGLKSNWSWSTSRYALSGVSYVDVNAPSISYKFTESGSTYTPAKQDGSSLTRSGTSPYTYTFTDSMGSKVIFTGERPTQIIRPDGTIYTYTYSSVTYCVNPSESGCLAYSTKYRAQSITSNSGYQLKLGYASNTASTGPTGADAWLRLTSVMAINNAVDYCDPAANSCSSLTLTWPTATISTDTVNNKVSITDALNRVTRFSFYYAALYGHNLTAIKTPSSTTDDISLSVGTLPGMPAYVATISRPEGAWSYTYVDSGGVRTTTVTDPLSHQRVVTSDLSIGRVKTDKDALNRTTSFNYDGAGRLTRVTWPEGNASGGYVAYTYDARGNITQTQVVPKAGSGLSTLISSASFDPTCANIVKCNKPNSTTDARNTTTNYEYSTVHGGVTKVTVPAPVAGGNRPETRYTYSSLQSYFKNSSGTIVASGAPIYKLTSVSACQTGSASCAGTATEAKSTISYGTAGVANNLLPTVQSSGAGDGSLTATTGMTYDAIGNAAYVDGPLSGTADTTRTLYDAMRQTVGQIGPDPDGSGTLKNRAMRLSYNADGQVTKTERGTTNGQTDAAWSAFAPTEVVDTVYDAANRPIKNMLSTGSTVYAVTQASYLANNLLDCSAQRMNPAVFASLPTSACSLGTTGNAGPDRITKRLYNNADQLAKVQSAFGITTANGFPATLQRDEVTYTYTNDSKVGTATDAKNNVTTYEYDGFDRLTKTRYPSPTTSGSSSTTDYEQPGYDANSNVVSARLRDGQIIGFTFDNLNRVTLKDLPGSEPDVSYGYDNLGRVLSASHTGNALSFTYDALNRNLTQVGPLGTVTSTWDVAGRRTRLNLPGGYYTTYDYLVTNEMTAIRESGAVSGVGVLAIFGYDNLGNRVTLTRGNGSSTSYTPDAISRLSSLTQNLTSTASDQTLGFTYNAASQIATRSASNDAYAMRQQWNADRGYTVNGLNQYLKAGSASPTYDGRGNLTAQSNTIYSYSVENLLKSATTSSVMINLGYDPLARLFETGGVSTTRFLYDGTDLVAEYDATGAVLRRYAHGPGADEPLVWYEGADTSDRRWLHADERNSIIAVSNASGTAIQLNAYDEYGNPQSGNIGRFGYTGQTWIAEPALWYYKARMYNPRLGRFMQTDPIGYQGGMNLYAYVGNDPVNARDPMGLDTIYVTGSRRGIGSTGIFGGGGGSGTGPGREGNENSIVVAGGCSAGSTKVGSGTSAKCVPNTALPPSTPPKPNLPSDGITVTEQSPQSVNDIVVTAQKQNKSECIQECVWILDRPQPPGSDRNLWDFHKCVNACMARDPNLFKPRVPVPQPPSPKPQGPNPWVVGGAVVIGGVVIVGGLILAPGITIPALILGGAASR